MEKTRVKKGEKYWYIWLDERYKLSILQMLDMYDKSDDAHFEDGNYFNTREEAEDMLNFFHRVLFKTNDNEILNKLDAVLKGADVIEMPSEEEIREKADDLALTEEPYDENDYGDLEYGISNMSNCGVRMAEYLKSKIVK